MKKIILIIIFLALMAPLLQSCTHSCTCENPDGKITDIDINPSENCNDYSNATRGDCS